MTTLVNAGTRWTKDEEIALLSMTAQGMDITQIAKALSRSAPAIVQFCCERNLPRPKTPGRQARTTDGFNYKANAIAGLRHCKDLAAFHPYGCGELSVTSDGVPHNYRSYANHFSVVTSMGQLCAEAVG